MFRVKNLILTCLVLTSSVFLQSCLRGQPSEKPPFHVFLDMDDQPKYQAYEKSDFFADGSAMRLPVEGTVAFESHKAAQINSGSNGNPVEKERSVLLRGQEVYQVYCTPCHGDQGDGKGIIALRGAKYGYVAPSNFHDERIREYNDKHYYDAISNGIRNMGGYGARIVPKDRWAVVHYVRALQLSQNANESDVPEHVLETLNK